MHEEIIDFPDQPKKEFYFPKPPLLKRIQSVLLDSLTIVILLFIANFIVNTLKIESAFIKAIFILLIFLYEPIFVSFGQTIGQRIVGLRVSRISATKSSTGEKNINFFMSLIRYISKILLGWISLLTIHSDRYGQALHDKISGSVMTYA